MIRNIIEIIQMLADRPGEMYIMTPTTAFTMVEGQVFIITGENFDQMSADELNEYIQITALRQRLG